MNEGLLTLGDVVPADDAVLGLAKARELLIGTRPIQHPEFRRVTREVVSAVKGSPLTLLLGVSGVGKTHLAESLVIRLNQRLGKPGRIPGVILVAPSTQKTRFSWKAFWTRLLVALEDPLPEHKVHPGAQALAFQERFHQKSRRYGRLTESQYFEIVCSAAAERGLLLLVIDEAEALARNEAGDTLYDQITVLRELADKDLFRILLVSTVKIRSHLRRSGVLNRRLATVVFPRYRLQDGEGADETYESFVRSAFSFMQRLPEASRMELSNCEYQALFRNSLGCVGLLCDWYARAIWDCVDSGRSELSWANFARRVLSMDSRAHLAVEAREAEDELAVISDLRLDVTEEELYQIGLAQARRHQASTGRRRLGSSTSALREASRGKSRPGVPNPSRRPLP